MAILRSKNRGFLTHSCERDAESYYDMLIFISIALLLEIYYNFSKQCCESGYEGLLILRILGQFYGPYVYLIELLVSQVDYFQRSS